MSQAAERFFVKHNALPTMPELMSSLPLVGVDGTLKRSRAGNASAHLKTGSLRDSMGIAGYVDGANGQRFVLVAMVNHANAQQARDYVWAAGSSTVFPFATRVAENYAKKTGKKAPKVESLGILLLDRVQSDDPTALIGLPLIATTRLLRQAHGRARTGTLTSASSVSFVRAPNSRSSHAHVFDFTVPLH